MINILEQCKVVVKSTEISLPEILKVKNQEKQNKFKSNLFTQLDVRDYLDNPYILNKYFTTENGTRCARANLIKVKLENPDIELKDLKEMLKADFGKSISLAGYKYNPEHYKFACSYLQQEFEEDLFRESEDPEELKKFFKSRECRELDTLDFEAYEKLYLILANAIKNRVVILWNVENVPAMLSNAMNCWNSDVSCRMSNAAMNSKLEELYEIYSNLKVSGWTFEKTDLIFDKYDYISTYQKVLRQISDIRNESLEELRASFHNEEDPYEEEILANDLENEVPYYEDTDYEDNEFEDFGGEE